ncbi:hypothetical protein VPH35_070678 [Triticum aestivum]
MTKRAARIVLSLAGDIRLKQFPEAIGSISSLLDASGREVNEYKELMLQGLLIIEKLVTHEGNCRHIIPYLNDLLNDILKPLSSNIMHRITGHDACSHHVDASLQVLCTWFNTTTGKVGYYPLRLPKQSLSAMETILTCVQCHKERHILAMKVLITQIQDKENIVVQLLGIFIDYRKDEYTTMLAGEKLLTLSKESRSNAKVILEAKDGSVEKIIRLFLNEGNEKLIICSAGILEGLCTHYITSHKLRRNELCFQNLKWCMIHLIPKLLIQIFPPKCPEEKEVSSDTDIQRQKKIVASAGNSQHGIVQVQHQDKKLQAALLSLCFTVYHKMINKEFELAPLLDKIRSMDPQFNLPRRLGELVERNSDFMVLDCLRVVKYTAKMAKSMMRHKRSYTYKELDGLMSSLERVCTPMSDLDAFVNLSGDEVGDTLDSLVREARDGDDTLSTLVQEALALFRPTEQGQKSGVSVKEKVLVQITELGRPSSGLSVSPKLVFMSCYDTLFV